MKPTNRHNKRPRSVSAWAAAFLILFGLCLLLTQSLGWALDHFGSVDMDSILFTLSMPLDGGGSAFIEDFLIRVLVPWLCITAFVCVVTVLLLRSANHPEKKRIVYTVDFALAGRKPAQLRIGGRSKKKKRSFCAAHPAAVHTVLCLCFAGWMAGLVIRADQSFGFFRYVDSLMHPSVIYEEEYVDPNSVSITFPEKKRNLIYIFLESGESSAQDTSHGGLFPENYIPEMTRIAEENISFSHSDKIEGAVAAPGGTWTTGGMVSQFSGVPLKLPSGQSNEMSRFEKFLPGVTNLGDILAEQGYHNYWLLGSSASFGGCDKYMQQHGNYEIYDFSSAISDGRIPPDYDIGWWGVEDSKLYDYAKETLTELAAEDTPFNFCMITIDTHHIAGYVCPLCRSDFDEQYANVWACASRQLDDFLTWCSRQPFYENTSIVISGDHCSMDPYFYSEFPYRDENGTPLRKVYNAFVNSAAAPVHEKNRRFTTLDMFPSILASMGAEIEGDRLGLGTNLFSDRQTLSEEYGYDKLFSELERRSEFYQNVLFEGAKP